MLNPVLRREVVTLLRTWRTLIFIALYTLGLAVVALLSLLSVSSNVYSGFDPKNTVSIYVTLASFQFALILLFVPVIAAGSISGERERQTLDLMLVAKTSTFSIVTGKLMASLLIVVMMIIASLPVFGIVMFFDSVSIPDLLMTAAFSILTAAMVGSLSILISSIFKKTVVAVAVTYLIMIVLFLGGYLGIIIFNSLFPAWSWFPRFSPAAIFAFGCGNPVMGIISVFDTQLGYVNISSLVNRAANRYQPAVIIQFVSVVPLWVFNMLFDALFIILACILAAALIKPTGRLRLFMKRK